MKYNIHINQLTWKSLMQLIAEWEVEGGFLDNGHDTSYDRAVGRTYKKCAYELRKALGVET